MNKEKYEELLLRFALELKDSGVTKSMIEIIEAQCARTPNVSSVSTKEDTARFTYRHGGFLIEAKQTVELVIKTCK